MGESTSQAKQRRKGGRWWLAVRLVVALVLGMMTTYGVAWGNALLRAPDMTFWHERHMYVRDSPFWVPVAPDRYHGGETRPWATVSTVSARGAVLWRIGSAVLPVFDEKAPVFTEHRAQMPTWVLAFIDNDLRPSDVTEICAVGWPWLTHWSCQRSDVDRLTKADYSEGAWLLPGALRAALKPLIRGDIFREHMPIEVPLRIIWPNFIAATALWAAVWLGLMTLPPIAVRARRRRRGVCVRCRYSRLGLAQEARCPECGLAEGSAGERGALAKPGTAP